MLHRAGTTALGVWVKLTTRTKINSLQRYIIEYSLWNLSIMLQYNYINKNVITSDIIKNFKKWINLSRENVVNRKGLWDDSDVRQGL